MKDLEPRQAPGVFLEVSRVYVCTLCLHMCVLAPHNRDQDDRGLKPARAKSLQDLISKITNTKRAGGVTQGVD
jgi:hypothetical protein